MLFNTSLLRVGCGRRGRVLDPPEAPVAFGCLARLPGSADDWPVPGADSRACCSLACEQVGAPSGGALLHSSFAPPGRTTMNTDIEG